jgi:hypothetical protein
MVFFNARSIFNKADVFKSFMTDKRAAYGGISESKTYNDTAGLSDSTFRWDAGTEGKPKSGAGPTRGMGAFIDRTAIKASIVETGTYTVWHRVETRARAGEGKSKPIFVGWATFLTHKTRRATPRPTKSSLAACGSIVTWGMWCSAVTSTPTRASITTRPQWMMLVSCC